MKLTTRQTAEDRWRPSSISKPDCGRKVKDNEDMRNEPDGD